MSSDIQFVPEDFENIYTVEEIQKEFIPIIQSIRNGETQYKNILDTLTELMNLVDQRTGKLSKNNSLERLFTAYKQLQTVSLQLRNSLNNFNIEKYDSIDYAIYYDGMRYHLDHLDISMLRKNSKGTLQLNLAKATKELREASHDDIQDAIEQLFRNHYAAFLQVIQKTYNGGIIGQRQQKGQRLNLGHVAEAFEAHTQEHDKNFYNIFKDRKNLTVLDKMALTQIPESTLQDQWWGHHEDINEAWKHIRGALGTQRGTVAGDVLRTQVKSGTSKSPRVRLASLNQLNQGIRTYSTILNPDISVEEAAKEIALWITEPVTVEGAKIAAQQSNKVFDKLLDDNLRHL